MHVRQAAHELRPAVAVNVLEAHAAHSRSDVDVAAAVSYEPATHGAVSGAHASPAVVAENELPSTHAAHRRSAMEEPAADWPSPAGQVRHAAHVPWPATEVNVPAAHGLHSRFDVSDGALDSYDPLPHAAESTVHSRSLVADGAKASYCPSTHTAVFWHTRSDEVVGERRSNVPTPHVARHALHAARPVSLAKVPAAHARHCAEASPTAQRLGWKVPAGQASQWLALAVLRSELPTLPASQHAHSAT